MNDFRRDGCGICLTGGMFDETAEAAWQLRFGASAPKAAESVAPFLRHRSVRKYSDRPVSHELAAALVGAAQSAATSSNLQLWSVVSVQEPGRRDQMAELTQNPQVRTAGYFFAFLADHHRLREAGRTEGEPCEGLEYMEFYTMAVIDAALAAERMVCAAENVGLGICYIGGLRNNPEAIRQLLLLPEGVFGVFGLCVGWPAEDAHDDIKPRLHPRSIWFEERYPEVVDVTEYDERMKAFYENQRMKGDAKWSKRSSRRTDTKHMTGRATQLDWIRGQGFAKQ